MLPFGVNCRQQLAGPGKKREDVKPTCFMSKATLVPQTNHSQHSSPVNLIVESKSLPVELNNSTFKLHVPSRQKKSLQSYCSLMSRCVTPQVSINSQIHVIKTMSHFHFYW